MRFGIVMIVMLLVTVFIIGGGIFLQIFLSKMENKILGLLLPVLCFLISIIAVMSVATYQGIGTLSVEAVSESGEVISTVVEQSAASKDGTSAIFVAIPVFIMYNIPTVILLAIYIACREKIRRNKELERMSLQDLQ